MNYRVLGNIPDGGERRRYDSGVELEVDRRRGFVPTWVGHGFLPHLRPLKGTVLDYGCGGGLLGLHAAVQASVDRVIFLDIDEAALDLARDNAQWNLVTAKCDFISSVEQVSERVGTVIANLPENPHLDFCGIDGSDLQREVVLQRVPNLLRSNGCLLTKSIDYAADWPNDTDVQSIYNQQLLGKVCGLTPDVFTDKRIAGAKIHALTLKS
jgi:SAM-dependent methyltransferase